MRATLRLLLAILGVSAVLIALSILLTGAAATADLGERVFDVLAHRHDPPSPPWPRLRPWPRRKRRTPSTTTT